MATQDSAHSSTNDAAIPPWRNGGEAQQPTEVPVAPAVLKKDAVLEQPKPNSKQVREIEKPTEPQPQAATSVPEIITPTKQTIIRSSVQEVILKTEHLLLGTLSLVLIGHGAINLYGEIIEIFYVFPHIPEIYQLLDYSADIYTSVYRRSVIISGTTLLETVYGTLLISRFEKLTHRLHIFSALSLLVISTYLLRGLPPLDVSEYEDFPEPPTLQNLINAENNHERIELFRSINKEFVVDAVLESSPSGDLERE